MCTNISNGLVINSLLVAQPTDQSAIIFVENSRGSAGAKYLNFGNMLMPTENLARNNLCYLYQQQQSSSLSRSISNNSAYNKRMEATSNLIVGNAPIFLVSCDPRG